MNNVINMSEINPNIINIDDIPRNGYSKLASLMGRHPEVAILRRFSTLNVRNLLYLQAELVHLEHQLALCTKADLESRDQDRVEYDRDWYALSSSGQAVRDRSDGDGEQWRIVMEIRKVLKEYNEALQNFFLLTKQPGPNRQDLGFLQTWMAHPKMGHVHFLGADHSIWEDPDLVDLMALRAPEQQSLGSRVLRARIVKWYHWTLGRRFKKPGPEEIYANTVHYSQGRLLQLSILIGMVCASLLPVLAIVVLCYVTSMKKRLVIIGAFTALFSAALGVFTSGRVIEIFSATAAFAAVQVVFVGTTSGNLAGGVTTIKNCSTGTISG